MADLEPRGSIFTPPKKTTQNADSSCLSGLNSAVAITFSPLERSEAVRVCMVGGGSPTLWDRSVCRGEGGFRRFYRYRDSGIWALGRGFRVLSLGFVSQHHPVLVHNCKCHIPPTPFLFIKAAFVRKSVCLSVCLSLCLSACLSVYRSICPSVSLCVCLSICPYVYLSIYLTVYLSFLLSFCLSIYPSIYLPLHDCIRACGRVYLPKWFSAMASRPSSTLKI